MRAVLGIGINVNQNPGVNESMIGNDAVSIADIVGHKLEREAVLASVLNHLEPLLGKDLPTVLSLYAKHEILVGKEVLVRPRGKGDTTDEYTAKAVGFGPTGELRVLRGNQEVTLSAEDVSIRPTADPKP